MINLKDIAEIQTGVFLKPAPNPDTIYLQANDFDNEGVVLPTTKHSVITNKKNQHHILASGNLLFMAKGYRNFCSVFNDCGVKCAASSSFLVIKIKDAKVMPEYLNWYLNLPVIITQLRVNAVGSAIPSITKAMIEEVEVPVPSIDKQKAIIELAALQKREQQIYNEIAGKRKQLIDNKLKYIIENGK